MSLTNEQRLFYTRWDDHPVPVSRDWEETVSNILDEGLYEAVEASVPRSQQPLKLSDPFLLSDGFRLSDYVDLQQDRFYSTEDGQSRLKSYPLPDSGRVHVKNPTLFVNQPNVSQSFLTPASAGKPRRSYRVRKRPRSSPPLQSVAHKTVQSGFRVQGSSHICRYESALQGADRVPLPVSDLYGDFRNTSPETIAYGLFTAVAQSDVESVVGLLREIIDFYIRRVVAVDTEDGYEASADEAPGFPHNIDRESFKAEGNILLSENALLGIAVLEASFFLYNRPVSQVQSLSGTDSLDRRIRFVVAQLSRLFVVATEQGSTLSSATLSPEGYFLGDKSLEACFLASIFLSQSLQIDYSLRIHSTVANLYLKMAEIPSFPVSQVRLPNTADKSRARTLAAQILWFLHFPQSDADTIPILQSLVKTLARWELKNVATTDANVATDESGDTVNVSVKRSKSSDYTASDPLVYFTQGFIQAVFPEFRYADGDSLTDFPIVPFPTLKDGLYRRNGNFPKLIDQCEMALADSDYRFFDERPAFPLLAEEAILSVWLLFQEAKRLLPEGDRWFYRETLRDPNSAIVSLLFSLAQASFANFLRYHLIRVGNDPSAAAGFVLAQYARVYLEKPLLTADTVWRGYIDSYLRTDNTDYSKIAQTVQAIAGDDLILKQPSPYRYFSRSLDTSEVVIQTFDPNCDEDLFQLSFDEGIREIISADSDFRIGNSEALSASSEQRLSDLWDEPIYVPDDALGDAERILDQGDLIGYVESQSESNTSTSVLQDFIPAGVDYRRARLQTISDSDRNRLGKALSVTHYVPSAPVRLTVAVGSQCHYIPRNQALYLENRDGDQITVVINGVEYDLVVRNAYRNRRTRQRAFSRWI